MCDGDLDCPDGSDEDSSPAGPCGECPRTARRLPRHSLLTCRSSAANSTCADDQFMRCDINRCIPNSWICDGQKGELAPSEVSEPASTH